MFIIKMKCQKHYIAIALYLGLGVGNLQLNDTCILSLLYPDLDKKDYFYGFACSQSPQSFFDFMRLVIGPLLQQPPTTRTVSGVLNMSI